MDGPLRRSSASIFTSRKNNIRTTSVIGNKAGDCLSFVEESSDSDGAIDVLSTKSLVGSILEYPVENGRQYASLDPHAYHMPNDEVEQDRLNFTHQVYLKALSRNLTLAPLSSDISHILDVGTGTGEWACDIAEKYPTAEVIGFDISAIQPSAVPSNVFFEIENAEYEWEYSQKFDFIHIRDLLGAFDSWPNVYAQAYRSLKPGGFIEIVDHGRPVFPHSSDPTAWPACVEMLSALDLAFLRNGRTYSLDHHSEELLQRAGFENVQRSVIKMPFCGANTLSEPEHAKWTFVALSESVEAVVLRPLTRDCGWGLHKVKKLVDEVKKELFAMTRQSDSGWSPLHFTVAQKPF